MSFPSPSSYQKPPRPPRRASHHLGKGLSEPQREPGNSHTPRHPWLSGFSQSLHHHILSEPSGVPVTLPKELRHVVSPS